MTTLSELAKASNDTFDTFSDNTFPEGHFGATVIIDGHLRGYLLEGEQDGPDAVVKGRIEYVSEKGKGVPYAFAGGDMTGGTPLGEVTDFAETLAKMV